MRALLVVILIFTWNGAAYSQEENPCEHPDFNALMALYEATGGDSWTNNENWDDGTGTISCDPCGDRWFGVSCDDQDRVIELRLHNNNLSGTIPPEIGYLSELQELDLSRNMLSNEVPEEIVILTNLKFLSLEFNDLTGNPLEMLCYLKDLEVVTLRVNGFSGEVPDCVGDLSKLIEFNIVANNFSGNMPSRLGGLPNLEYLLISSNNFTGTLPESYGSLVDLKEFSVGFNPIEGCLPASYSVLCGIGFVEISNTSSVVLNRLGAWSSFCSGDATMIMHPDYPALVAFYKATNGPFWHDKANWDDGSASVSCDPCTDGWYGVTCVGGRVAELRLGDNNLSGALPPEIGQLEYLEHIDLIDNLISGEIPKELGLLADLEYLDLGRNEFEGSLPMELGDLGNLEDFYIDENRLEGCWPSNMSGICGLARFEMDGNVSSTISNAGWAVFCATQVGQVHIDYDPLISIYKELDGINWTRSDNWEPYNSCSNPCDEWYGVTCTGGRVTGLELPLNDLKGVLPDKMEGLTELTGIDLAGNEIEGEFPGPLEDLDQLTAIKLKGNQLRGELPTIMPWPVLDTLALGSNLLTGPTTDFGFGGNWTRLNYINLHDNLFSEWNSLPYYQINNLEFYLVTNNYLSGCFVSSTFDFCSPNLTIRTQGNPSLPDFEAYCESGIGLCNYCTKKSNISLNDDPFDIRHIDLVNGTIRSNGRIGMDNSVFLQSSQSIQLDQEFTVEANSNLILKIKDCISIPDFGDLRTK